jgi:hypothetical protein
MSKPTNWANSKDLIRAAILLLLVAALTAAPALQAQIVSFADIQSTILGSGLGSPTGVAIDGLSGTGVLPATTTVQAAGGQYSDPVKLTAVIGPSGLIFAGSLQFKVGGVPACAVAVTGSGTYSCNYTLTQATFSYTINADLTSSDLSVQGSSGSNKLTVIKEDVTIVPSPANPITVKVNATAGEASPVALKGTLQQQADGSPGDFSLAAVTVTLEIGTSFISCPVTNVGGVLQAICDNVPPGAYSVKWKVGGNYYQGSTVSTVLTVIQ